MKKINIVKKNTEFNNIMKIGKKYSSDIFYVYVVDNSYQFNRYGISVSKKVGNAVTRNKYKRRIKDIIDDTVILDIVKNHHSDNGNNLVNFFKQIDDKN